VARRHFVQMRNERIASQRRRHVIYAALTSGRIAA
jgi:hypothetical protein